MIIRLPHITLDNEYRDVHIYYSYQTISTTTNIEIVKSNSMCEYRQKRRSGF